MSTPEIIVLSLYGVNLACYVILHGSPRTGTYHFSTGALGTLLSFGLLYWAGLFRELFI